MPELLHVTREGSAAVLTMDSPARRNALGLQLRQEIVDALEAIEGDATVRCIVLTGAGGVFSSGGDIAGMDVADLASGRERFRLSHRLVRLLVKGAKPVIAAVEGWCAGGALGMALGCDTIIAGAGARFVTPFGKVGLVPDFGCLHLLPQRVGAGQARQLMLYCQPIDATEAQRIGLVEQVVPEGGALQAALERARLFDGIAPLTVAMTRQALSVGLDAALDWERDIQSAMFMTADHAEGKAAFMAKRPPAFKGA